MGMGDAHLCPFDLLLTNNVPHIVEEIFFSLDYESFKACCSVCKAWRGLLTSEPFRSYFQEEISEDERKLMSASKEGNTEEVKEILSDGMVDVNCLVNKSIESTPLCKAVRNGHTAVLQILLDGAADPNGADKYGRTPLYWAARKQCEYSTQMIQILIRRGADARQQMDGPTPLHWAAHYGLQYGVRLLIDNGAVPDKKDFQGYTPLQWAKRNHGNLDRDVVKVLLEQGNEPGDWELLQWAATNGHGDIAQLLIDKGAKFNKAGDFGLTPLHLAASNGHSDVVRILVDRRADLNKRDLYGRTPLHYAVDPHRSDLKGKSRIRKAVEERYKDAVRTLLDGGADPNVIDLNDNSILKSARESGHTELVPILIEAGAKPEEGKSEDTGSAIDQGRERRMTKHLGRRAQRKDRRDKKFDRTNSIYEEYEYEYKMNTR